MSSLFRLTLCAALLGASWVSQAMDMHTMQRVVPLPNLMMLANQRADTLQLTPEQQARLKSWAGQHLPAQNQLAGEIVRLEKQLRELILAGASAEVVDGVTRELETPRAALIQIRRQCAEEVRRVLTPAQWGQLQAILPAVGAAAPMMGKPAM